MRVINKPLAQLIKLAVIDGKETNKSSIIVIVIIIGWIINSVPQNYCFFRSISFMTGNTLTYCNKKLFSIYKMLLIARLLSAKINKSNYSSSLNAQYFRVWNVCWCQWCERAQLRRLSEKCCFVDVCLEWTKICCLKWISWFHRNCLITSIPSAKNYNLNAQSTRDAIMSCCVL